jgi:hypothetical protein
MGNLTCYLIAQYQFVIQYQYHSVDSVVYIIQTYNKLITFRICNVIPMLNQARGIH